MQYSEPYETLGVPAPVPLVRCRCGAVVLACVKPDCCIDHAPRIVEACGRCTATGGMPVLDSDLDPDEPTP